MLYNQIKYIGRNLLAGKWYTLINIIGLAIGITSIVWGIQVLRYSYSFDDFHFDQAHIFRVLTKNETGNLKNGYCPIPLALYAPKDFASIEKAVRLEGLWVNIKGDQTEAFNTRVHYTDAAFFDFFNFPLVKGSNDLTDKSAVLLTESEAKKYFGKIDPIGKTLVFHTGELHQQSLVVKGIVKDIPLNSSIQFGMLTSIENYLKPDKSFLKADDWSFLVDVIFLKLTNPSDASRLEKDFEKYIPLQNEARKEIKVKHFFLDPLPNISNHDQDMASNELYNRPGDSATYGCLILGILILLSSCLNFANTTVARSNRRLKEMGVRKVLGGSKGQLIRQQLMECSAVVFLALLLSVVFTKWWLPTFNSMFDGIKIASDYIHDTGLQKALLIVLFGVTIVAGLYPAFYISKYNPTQIFRGGVNYGGTNLVSRLLLGLQLVIAFITVTAGFGFARNAAFQRDYNFGFNKNDLFGLHLTKENYMAIKNIATQMPEIENVGGSKGHVGYSWRNLTVQSEGIKKDITYVETGEHYADLMSLKLLSGRFFNESNTSDYKQSIVVTKGICGEYGWDENTALNKRILIDSINYSIVGVVDNIYMGGFFVKHPPVVFSQVLPEHYRLLVVKAKQGSLKSAYDQLRSKWAATYPNIPYNAFYLDEIGDEAQAVNESIAKIFFWFSIISIVMTATGMFALISLTILKKTREIAIRKVVGANLQQIFLVINKGYLLIFLIATFIGLYAGVSLTKLLMDLIFKINIGLNSIVVVQTILGVCIIIAIVVGLKLWDVNRMKPASVLKNNQ